MKCKSAQESVQKEVKYLRLLRATSSSCPAQTWNDEDQDQPSKGSETFEARSL